MPSGQSLIRSYLYHRASQAHGRQRFRREAQPGQLKTRTISRGWMVRVFLPLVARQRSTDKHLILSISLVNGLRYRRYENFEPATEARHNRRQLAGRLDDPPLNEIGSGNNLLMCSINRAAHQFDFVARIVCRLTHYLFKLANFVLDDSQRFGTIHGGSRKMAGHRTKLLSDEFSLNCNLSSLLTYYCHPFDQRFEFFLKTIYRFHSAVNEDGNSHHRHCKDDKRQSDNYHHPEHRIVRVHFVAPGET